MGRKKIRDGGTMTVTAWKPGQVTNPKGRESMFTEELGEQIVELLWTGECKSMTAVSRLPGMPTSRTLHTWCKTYPDFGAKMYEARCFLGDVYDDEIETIKNSMLSGNLDPHAAQVAIKSNQWKAMAVDPRNYATKSYVDKNERKTVEHVFTNRIPVEDMTDEELDSLESALQKTKLLLTGPSSED